MIFTSSNPGETPLGFCIKLPDGVSVDNKPLEAAVFLRQFFVAGIVNLWAA